MSRPGNSRSLRDLRTASAMQVERVSVGDCKLEVGQLPGREDLAPLVLLHEGLGCLSLWRSFPARLSELTGRRVVAYSRSGYGQSDPASLPRPVDYMHREALEVLPALVDLVELGRPVLVGHSDGASIALIYAGAAVGDVESLVLLAPHVFVEERTLEGIRAARRAYLEQDLAARLAKYHAEPDNAFWGWNDAWLSPGFMDWNIERFLPAISAPVLAVQDRDDPYGTPRQVEVIACKVGGRVRTHLLEGNSHSPHLDHADETLQVVSAWLEDPEKRPSAAPTPP